MKLIIYYNNIMSKKTDTFENIVFRGTVTIDTSDDPEDMGHGDLEVKGSVFTDNILENTVATGVNLEGTKFKDNYYIMKNTSILPTPNINEHIFYMENDILKIKHNSGVVKTVNPLNNKGDLLTHDGNDDIKIPMGLENQILTSNSVSGIKWEDISKINHESHNSFYIRDEKPIGTNGGAGIENGWNSRILNTISSYPSYSTRVTLNNNNVIFTPGTYKVNIIMPMTQVDNFALRLFDITHSEVLELGTSGYSSEVPGNFKFGRGASTSFSYLKGIFTFETTSSTSVQYRISNSNGSIDLGVAQGFQTEIYTTMFVRVLL